MDVILLERIGKLGQMGDTVTVKDGYARNYLLPTGKALRANAANNARFEAERAQLEARNLERKTEAEDVGGKLDGTSLVVIRSAGETGQLYGSVSTRDVANDLTEAGFSIEKSQIELKAPIKTIGLHEVEIVLHPEVSVSVSVNVARSPDEAERQAAGEDMSQRDAYADEEDDAPATEDLLDEGVELEGDEEAADDAEEEAALAETSDDEE